MSRLQKLSKLAFPLFFAGAGIIHFMWVDFYVQRIPEMVPFRREIVLTAGVVEALAGTLAYFGDSRKVASRFIMVFLLCVVPVNVVQLLRGGGASAVPTPVLWGRIGFLLLLSGWAYFNSNIGAAQASGASPHPASGQASQG